MMAAYYDKSYPDGAIAMMADDLKEFSLAEVSSAYKKYRLDPKNRTMPLPGQIIQMIKPVATNDAKAREITARIMDAFGRHGWSNAELARQYIGEVGWDIVQTSGGWSYLCQEYGVSIQPTTFMAQTRSRVQDRLEFGSNPVAYGLVGHIIKEVPRIGIQERSHEDQIAHEKDRQMEEFRKVEIMPPRADPNADYVAKTPEERELIIQNFLKGIKSMGLK